MKNTKGAMDHLTNHQTYPATKADLVATCNGLSDFSQEDKDEFAMKIPEGSYNSAQEVMKTLGL